MPNHKLIFIGFMKNQITGSKFPSNKDCFSVLFYNMKFAR